MNMIDGLSISVDYDDWLKCSINHFMIKYHKNDSDLSRFQHVYQQKFQGNKDLPIEIVWFRTAASFHCSKPNSLPPPEKLLVVKELLHSLKTTSSNYSVVKKIAIMAPAFYLLYHLDLQFSENDWCSREEIRSDIEELTCYLSICCSQCLNEGEKGLNSLRESFMDVLMVWTLDQIQGICAHADIIRTFFPILNNMFQYEITASLGYLAGAVMAETLMWRMCLRIPQVTKEHLHGNMLSLAVQTIKGFQNFYFIDMLFKMLLEPHLPVTSLMCSRDAIILHKVLYDAVVLIDYSFYYERWSQSSESHSKLAPLWLLVADRAIMFAWSKNDIVLVHSYLEAFHKCQIVAEIINWVNIRTGMEVPDIGSIIVTPRVFIEWLLIQEDHGIKIFDSALSHYARATISMTPMERNSFFKTPVNDNIQLDSSSTQHDTLCPVKGLIDGKKRKEIFPEVQESQLKHVKYGDEGPTWNFFPCSSDDESCDGTEVIFADFDDDEGIDEEEINDEETEGEH